MKDNRVIRASTKIKITKGKLQSILTIESSKLEDEGNYVCKLENEFGQAETSCKVLYEG